jgi:hypothetical protein
VAATAAGLALFAYSGIAATRVPAFCSSRTSFIQDIEQLALDVRFALRGSAERSGQK